MLRTIINLILFALIIFAAGVIFLKINGPPVQQNPSKAESPNVASPKDEKTLRVEQQKLLIEQSKDMDWSGFKEEAAKAKALANRPSRIVEGRLDYPYLCFLPRKYDEESLKKYPLILYLHDRNDSNADLRFLYTQAPLVYLKQKDETDFIYVSPLAPTNAEWRLSILNSFLSKIQTEYPIDLTRIYLTGYGMGADATWEWACANPNLFAAIAPFGGGGDPDRARIKLRDTPIWVFQSENEIADPSKSGVKTIETLKPINPDFKASVVTSSSQDALESVYGRTALYIWLLTHKRS